MDQVDVVQRLAALGAYGDSIQKLCDAEDWADPRFKLVVRDALGLRPRIHARQWEDAAAFITLAEAGKLHPGARGIGFGSGREPLTFAVGARAGHLIATDLYEAGTAWTVARTADPRAFVLGAAPPGFPAERLDVHHMDMREITYPDAHFDFCYSISAFEHIGDDADFLRHFQEVRRVLKPDGIYALTTEVYLGETTRRTRGNYAFAIHDLLRLFAEAGLQAAATVDMRLSDLSENEPRALVSTRHDDPAEPMIQGLTIRDQAGYVSAPVNFLLRPAQGAPRPVAVLGREETFAHAERSRIVQRHRRFARWVRLNPWAQQDGRSWPGVGPDATVPAKAGDRLFNTAFLEFGWGRMEFHVVLAPGQPAEAPGEVAVRLLAWKPGSSLPRQVVHQQIVAVNAAPGATGVARFDVPTQAGTVYAVTGQMVRGNALFASIDVQARRAARASAIPTATA